METELIIVNMGQKRVILGNCNIKVTIEIKFCFYSAYGITWPIYGQKTTVVPLHLVSSVYIYNFYQILADQYYLFEPGDLNFDVYAYIMNSEISTVRV